MTRKQELQDFFNGLLKRGATRKEIAYLLDISYTVASHIMGPPNEERQENYPDAYQKMRYLLLEKDKLQHFYLYLELKREFNGRAEEASETR